MTLSLPPLALYVHIPWCLKKCPYCDFNSHAFQGELPEEDYIACLLADLENDLHLVQDRELASIFIGGGTPSLFSARGMARLLDGIQQRIAPAGNIEITMEANPGTFEVEKFSGFRAAGINRLSIGIQSFEPGMLERLGRVHDDREARSAAEGARAAGFDNFNLDLMFGLPGQDRAMAMSDLETAQEIAPPHLSWYQLTIEPNTVFYSRPPRLPGDEVIAEIQDAGIALLSGSGLVRYEVSAFAAPGRQSRHNLNYWQFGDYLGLGAGAHGKITLPRENRIIRTRKKRQPAAYMSAEDRFDAAVSPVPDIELPLEFLMNALRLCDGVDAGLFSARTGLALEDIEKPLSRLREKQLLRGDRLATTDTGFRFLNDVLAEFLPAPGHRGARIPVHSQ